MNTNTSGVLISYYNILGQFFEFSAADHQTLFVQHDLPVALVGGINIAQRCVQEVVA